MGALINIFKRLFGGILGFIGGLFSGKKKAIDGSTVEGNKVSAVKSEKPAKAQKARKLKKDKDGFYALADESMMEELPAANAIVKTTIVKTDEKEKNVKAVPAKAVAKAVVAMSSEDLIIAALKLNQAPAPVNTEAQVPTPTAGFATQYLVPTLTSGRRSPGPSLKGFKAMAKEIRG